MNIGPAQWIGKRVDRRTKLFNCNVSQVRKMRGESEGCSPRPRGRGRVIVVRVGRRRWEEVFVLTTAVTPPPPWEWGTCLIAWKIHCIVMAQSEYSHLHQWVQAWLSRHGNDSFIQCLMESTSPWNLTLWHVAYVSNDLCPLMLLEISFLI